MIDEKILKISSLILLSAEKSVLKKAILSKPNDKSIQKTVLTKRVISKRDALQAETFHKDNKATHKNLFFDEINADSLCELLCEFKQINLITSIGECELRTSSSGKTALLNDKKLERTLETTTVDSTTEILSNNREKKRILDGSEPFLKLLGVSDENGRVFDKKQSKFKQINRFLEIIRDCEDKLPNKSIRICDLCCGKSYLSFAAYHYFANVRKMNVSMTGIDLKPDVIKDCASIAKQLGFDGLEFICGDINDYTPASPPSLVISLHACDVATDIVLTKAADWKTNVILSTPCCHHELNHSINCPELEFITRHSMLRQKLCDAATDALRLLRLEAQGYVTSTIELIDPNETPKNVMLRAIKAKNFDPQSKDAIIAMEHYLNAKKFLCGKNSIDKFHF
ncbi:MAG: SAM-dependent methyltransferase [Ruminococcaceae bacterium]|nr:SAM-dependent methyltransferase [Oscillospiraceae bacterium]